MEAILSKLNAANVRYVVIGGRRSYSVPFGTARTS